MQEWLADGRTLRVRSTALGSNGLALYYWPAPVMAVALHEDQLLVLARSSDPLHPFLSACPLPRHA